MAKSRLWWIILPYAAVFIGMIFLRNAWGTLIGFHLALLALLVPHWRILIPRFLASVSKKVLLPIAAGGLLAGLSLWLLWPLTGLSSDYNARVAALGLSGKAWLPFIAYFTLVNPWLEEAYWRLVLGSPSHLPAPVDFLYSGYHLLIVGLFVNLAWVSLAFIILAFAGWLWRQVSRYTGSLLPAAISHLLADLSILTVLYLKASA